MNDVDLGPCCACGKNGPFVRNIVCLPYAAPESGAGWGCLQCHLPMDGAVAVLCDECLETNADIKFVIVGKPAEGRRMLLDELEKRPFDHKLKLHPEIFPANNPMADAVWFTDSPDLGPDCLCSWCGKAIEDDVPIRIFDEKSGQETRFHQTCIWQTRQSEILQ